MIDPPLRAVLFDIGETLWHAPSAPAAATFRELAAARAHEFLSFHRLDGFRSDEFARTAWNALEDAMRQARRTDLREPDYAAIVANELRRSGLDLDRDTSEAFLDAIYVSGADGGKEAYMGAADVLGELKRRGFRLGSVTNRAFGGERFRSDLLEAGLDVGWDSHSVSVEVGYLKPHPAIFEHALSALDLKPAEALMVGNSLAEDVRGAARLGIPTAWRRSAPDAEGVEPDVVFDDLSELLRLPALAAAR